LLGIKVIKLNKIKGTRTNGSNLLAARNRRELLFKAGNFRLPAQTKNSQTEISPHRRQLPSCQKSSLKSTAKKSASA
jgi:hypothetical protein